jgi:hypothetical protein
MLFVQLRIALKQLLFREQRAMEIEKIDHGQLILMPPLEVQDTEKIPLTPKASNHNRIPSFDSRSGSTETNSFESAAKDDLRGFDVWDDQQVKRFVQVREACYHFTQQN